MHMTIDLWVPRGIPFYSAHQIKIGLIRNVFHRESWHLSKTFVAPNSSQPAPVEAGVTFWRHSFDWDITLKQSSNHVFWVLDSLSPSWKVDTARVAAVAAGLTPLALEQPASAYDSVVAMLQSHLGGNRWVWTCLNIFQPKTQGRDQHDLKCSSGKCLILLLSLEVSCDGGQNLCPAPRFRLRHVYPSWQLNESQSDCFLLRLSWLATWHRLDYCEPWHHGLTGVKRVAPRQNVAKQAISGTHGNVWWSPSWLSKLLVVFKKSRDDPRWLK